MLALLIIVQRSLIYRLFLLFWLCLLAFPALGEPETPFLNIAISKSTIRVQAELAYKGPDDQVSLKKAAAQEVGALFMIDGSPLSGQLKEVQLSPSIRRDEITGEAASKDKEQQSLKAVWERPYKKATEPLVLSSMLQQPATFVVHHDGVRMNDRAPLEAQQTLELDWEDPWYSKFVKPELTRTPSESVACFLYLEPGQTRVEILARARDLESLGDLELGSNPELSVEKQAAVITQVGEILKSRLGVKFNDRPLELKLERVQFVHRTPTSADAIDPPEPVPTQLAAVGAILVGPAVTAKGDLNLRCDLFSPKVQAINAVVTEGEQTREVKLLPGADGVITVEAPPEGSILSPVSAPQGTSRGMVLAVALIVLIIGVALMIRGGTGSKVFLAGAALWLIAGVGALKWGMGPGQSDTKDRLQTLLGNIYQAFEAPTEETVYDRLAVSVEGELLSEVYLQTRKGLEAEQGVNVVVERVAVQTATITSSDWWGNGVSVSAFWEVSGRVGHWGHEHQRTNWYKADLKLKSVDGNWKITELEVLDEIRM